MLDETERLLPEARDDVVFSRVAEGGVLLSTDTEIYFGLNETGTRIWELLGACDTLEDLYRELEEEYPEVDRATLRHDAEELLDDLDEHGLVVYGS